MYHFVVSLDLGKKQDFSALAVLERPIWNGAKFSYLTEQVDTLSMEALATSGSFTRSYLINS